MKSLGALAVPVALVLATSLAGCSIDRALRPDAYTVQRGDSLSEIAAQYHIDWHDLAAWNHIGPPYRLSVGQTLYLKPFPPIDYARVGTTNSAPDINATASRHASSGVVSTYRQDRAPIVTAASVPSAPTPQNNPPSQAPTPQSQAPGQTAASGSAANAPAASDTRDQHATSPKPSTPSKSSASSNSSSDAEDAQITAASKSSSKTPTQPAAGGPSQDGWQWPASGALVHGFDPSDQHQGIEIGGQVGAPIYAASSGSVVYNGTGLKGYGRLIIIKHDTHYLSAYGFVKDSLVKQGQTVPAGAHIADMGLGPGNKPMLLFEIRKNGDPVDPEKLLRSR